MCILVLFNLIIFYFFGYTFFFKTRKINNNNLPLDTIDYNLKYSIFFKKILKIINNPIIFEYQLKQLEKINSNSNKFIEHTKFLNDIKNNKNLKTKKYYKKIINSLHQITSDENKKINILTKLLCINF